MLIRTQPITLLQIFTAYSILTLMLMVANLANTKLCKIPEK